MASGERGPTERVDATNYLVDSVNWSHSDWAHLSTVPFVSDIRRVSQKPQRPTRYQGREMITAEETAYIYAYLRAISFQNVRIVLQA